MFKGIRKSISDSVEDLKQWKESRVGFGKKTWSTFRSYIGRMKGGRLIREEIPYERAMSDWGFGAGEAATRRARAIVLFICAFFYAIALWCGIYFFRTLLVHVNVVSSLACLLGTATGLFVGTVNLWRWMVMRRKRYVPFLSWLKGGMRFPAAGKGPVSRG